MRQIYRPQTGTRAHAPAARTMRVHARLQARTHARTDPIIDAHDLPPHFFPQHEQRVKGGLLPKHEGPKTESVVRFGPGPGCVRAWVQTCVQRACVRAWWVGACVRLPRNPDAAHVLWTWLVRYPARLPRSPRATSPQSPRSIHPTRNRHCHIHEHSPSIHHTALVQSPPPANTSSPSSTTETDARLPSTRSIRIKSVVFWSMRFWLP